MRTGGIAIAAIILMVLLLSLSAPSNAVSSDDVTEFRHWLEQDFAPADDLLGADELGAYRDAAINGKCHLASLIVYRNFRARHAPPPPDDGLDAMDELASFVPFWWHTVAQLNYPLLHACYVGDLIEAAQTELLSLDRRQLFERDYNALTEQSRNSTGDEPLHVTVARYRNIHLNWILQAGSIDRAPYRIFFSRIAVKYGDQIFFDTGALPRGFVAYQLLTAKAGGPPIPDDFDALLDEATEGLTEDEIVRLTEAAEDWRPVDQMPPDGIDPFAEFEAIGISQPR